MSALGASESLTSVSSAKIGSPGTLESVASFSHKSEKSEREFELERIIAFLEENNLKGTMKSLLKELEAKPTPSKTSRVEQKTSSQPELVLSASLSSTKLTQSTDDARIVTGINSSLDLRSPIANKTSEPRTLSFSNEVGKNSGADDNFVMRESKSSNKGQNEYYESSAAFPTNTRKDSVHEVSEMETTEQGDVLARQPVTSGEDSILRRLRDLVSDMGAACFQKVMPSDSSMRMILPTMPEIIPADPSPIDGTHINTWTKGDLGYLPVVCPTLEEEARELWPLDEHGSALMTPYFPAGAGLSAAKVVTTLCAGASQLQRAPSVSQPCPYVRHAVPPRQPNQPPQLEVFDLKVIYEVGRTGFEEHKDFPIVPNSLIANRYQVLEYIGSAAFSRAVHCLDLKTDHQVCIKIIRNSKDFFDQSLDEIKLLQYVNTAGDADENCVVQLYDYFYYREHLFLVCELLKDNLYEFSKYNMEHPEEEFYFTLPRMQKITRSILLALKFIHALNLMHCDLKPENILIRSYSRCEIKVIDFGSSCFITDHLSSYIQSRCYRAPEVIIGMPYDQRIDIWSLGCILPELLTGQVLFLNDSVPQMLARIASLCGSYTPEMLAVARHAARFFTRNGVVYERKDPDGPISYLYSKPTALSSQLGSEDPLFIDFVTKCLTLDYTQRPTAEELLNHPFILADYGPIV